MKYGVTLVCPNTVSLHQMYAWIRTQGGYLYMCIKWKQYVRKVKWTQDKRADLETDTQSDLRNNLTSSWLLYGWSVGHWLTSGIERFLSRWLESHGIRLVLTKTRTQYSMRQEFRYANDISQIHSQSSWYNHVWLINLRCAVCSTHSCSWSSRTMASSSFFSCWLWLCSSSSRAFSLLLSVSVFFSWDSRRRTSSSR